MIRGRPLVEEEDAAPFNKSDVPTFAKNGKKDLMVSQAPGMKGISYLFYFCRRRKRYLSLLGNRIQEGGPVRPNLASNGEGGDV